jgi:glycosyltransferase involved in cell wall biosynthesis
MHICFLTHEYPKEGFPHGGVGTFIKTISRELINADIEVSVVGINYKPCDETENDNGTNIYRLSSAKVKGITWLIYAYRVNKKIREIHKNYPINIIESTELGLAFINKIKGVKYLIRLHGGHHFFADSENRGINWWKGFQEKRSFTKADKIIGVSNYVLNHTAEYINFEAKRGPVIYNPVDLNRFYLSEPDKVIKGRIFFAGTVCEKKGIRQLIEAFPLIKKEVPYARLIIAGRDWKYPDGSSYTEWVKQFIFDDDKDAVIFLGPVKNDDIPSFIEKAEVCVYPSHMEAMPLAWLEVLAMGKAFVGSRLGPGPEVVKDGVTGLLCDPLNPEDIAQKTINILMNHELGNSLGIAAREDIIQRFSIGKLLRQNIDFYMSI